MIGLRDDDPRSASMSLKLGGDDDPAKVEIQFVLPGNDQLESNKQLEELEPPPMRDVSPKVEAQPRHDYDVDAVRNPIDSVASATPAANQMSVPAVWVMAWSEIPPRDAKPPMNASTDMAAPPLMSIAVRSAK